MRKSKLLLVLTASVAVVLSACGGKPKPDTFTYRGYSSSLASNWNPHSWETNADSGVLGYLSEGLVSLAPKDTAGGVYQWVYDMAESIVDVTKTNAAALVSYLGMDATEADEYIAGLDEDDPGRYVYQIKLKDNLKWQDGTVINADSFIESGKRLLDPEMKNYRANLYIAGESAIAGAMNYYNTGSRVFLDNSLVGLVASDDDIVLKGDVYVQKANDLGIYIALDEPTDYLGGKTLKYYVDTYKGQLFDMTVWAELLTKVTTEGDNAYQLQLTQANLDLFKSLLDNSLGWGEDGSYWVVYAFVEKEFPVVGFETVGLQKVDDLTFNYVMATPIDEPQAFVSFSSTWLVHEDLYDANKDTAGALTVSTYNTKVENTMSYGPLTLILRNR